MIPLPDGGTRLLYEDAPEGEEIKQQFWLDVEETVEGILSTAFEI